MLVLVSGLDFGKIKKSDLGILKILFFWPVLGDRISKFVKNRQILTSHEPEIDKTSKLPMDLRLKKEVENKL